MEAKKKESPVDAATQMSKLQDFHREIAELWGRMAKETEKLDLPLPLPLDRVGNLLMWTSDGEPINRSPDSAQEAVALYLDKCTCEWHIFIDPLDTKLRFRADQLTECTAKLQEMLTKKGITGNK